MELFGFEINRKKEPRTAQSFVAPDDDGAIESEAVDTMAHTLMLRVLLILKSSSLRDTEIFLCMLMLIQPLKIS
jgi:hypothetical protein